MKHSLNAIIFSIVLSHSIATAQSERTLIHEAVIDAPVDVIWQLFTTSVGAQQWMAPKIDIDLRIGGEMRSSYHPDSTLDDEHTIINRILAYLPQRMIAIQNVQAPAGFDHAELFQQTWSVMQFDPIDDGRTRVRLVGLNYGEGPEWDQVYAHFEHGNAHLLGLLQQIAATFEAAHEEDSDAERAAREVSPIRSEISIDAPLERVWRAWTTEAGATAFWAREANIVLRIGGPYELFFAPEAPKSSRGTEGCRILAYEPQRVLAVSWNAPPHLPNARELYTWVVLEFDEHDNDRVNVQLTHLGFDVLHAAHLEHAAELDETREYFVRAWPHVMEHLKRTLEAR